MIPARILGTGSATPPDAVTTEDVVARSATPMSAAEARRRTGIERRHWAPPRSAVTPLAAEALGGALQAAGLEASALERLIFVSSTGGDLLIPATANLVARELGIRRSCDAFDLNNACTGFLTAFELAARCVATGSGPVGIVAAELFSPYVRADEPRPYLVMGDAAGACVVGPATGDEGILASCLRNDADRVEDVDMKHPSRSGEPAVLRFHIPNAEIGRAAIGGIAESAETVLAASGLAREAVDWVVPHQPNGPLLKAVLARLDMEDARVPAVYPEIGSVGAASLPFGLDRLWRGEELAPGSTLLMLAVGGGMSYGALLFRTGR